MSLLKDLKKVEDILLDTKLDIANKNLAESIRKINDVLDIISKMKRNKTILSEPLNNNSYTKFRKFRGLLG